MELFKLLGTVAVDCSGANSAIDGVVENASKSQSKLSSAFEKIGSTAVKIGTTVAAGYAAVSTAVNALAKEALEGYADYEQLVGGVETLFGAGGQSLEEYAASVGKTVDEAKGEYESLMQAQETVLQNADEAYKTAGMSANEYMETVTSFSASLIQSLGGDTEAAAEKANKAIIDMADNANKMGTDMTLIQNAYQGFAKQNYTMLDNLKLGYGGTQEEMKRLLADAEAISGIEFDISSYADVVDAIHVIQEEMGIAGTTAKEASETISGSIDSAKAAWQNLLAGLGKEDADLSGLVDNFVNSVITAAENILPRLGVIKDSIAEVAGDMFGRVFDHVSIGILNTGVSFEAVAGKIKTVISKIKDSAMQMLQGTVEWFSTDGMAIIEWLATDGMALIETVWETIQAGIDAVKPIVRSAFEWLMTDGVAMLQNVFNAIQIGIEFVKPIIQSIFEWISTDGVAILQALWQGIQAGIDIVSNVISVIWSAIQNVFNWFAETFEKTSSETEGILDKIKNFFLNAWEFIKGVWEGCKPFFDAVWQNVIAPVGEMLSEMFGAFQEAWNAIKAAWNLAVPFFQSVWQGIQGIFVVVAAVLGEFFKLAWEAIKAVWDAVQPYFAVLWTAIQGIFSVVGSVLSGFFKVAWEAIKAIWDIAISYFTAVWAGIRAVFAVVAAVLGGDFEHAWELVQNAWNQAGDFFQAVWGGIKNVFGSVVDWFSGVFWAALEAVANIIAQIVAIIAEKFTKAKEKVDEVFEGIRSTISNKLTEAKEIAISTFDAIAGAISNAINGAKDAVGSAIDAIKGFLDFEFELPEISVPQFSVNPPDWQMGDLLEGTIPEIGIQWHAKGGVMERPTIFGINGRNLMAGGEAGPEAIAPIDVLQDYIAQAVAAQNAGLVMVLEKILDAILAMDGNMGDNMKEALDGMSLGMNHREFARLVKAVN